MAGIGFALKRLGDQDSLASRSAAAGNAILISSGPWIVIMVGLAILTGLATPIIGMAETRIFQVLVIYSFALSLVITAPIALEATLRVSTLIYRREFSRVQSVYIGALVVAALASLVLGAIVFFGVMHLSFDLAIVALVCVIQVALLWVAMAFVAAIRQYAAVTLAFALGLSAAVVLGTAAAALGQGAGGMLLGFSFGLAVAFCILNYLILQNFPGKLPPLSLVFEHMKNARLLSITFAIAGLASALAVWIDKLIVWQSVEAVSLGSGLLYAPRYDSAIFISYLAIVPVMSVVVIWLETSFFDSYRHYRDIVHSGGTLRQIEQQRRILTRDTIDAISSAFLVQLTISVALAIASPWLANWIGFPFDALPVLRLAFAGAAFHLLFQASCGVILFVQYGKAFLWLQLTFLVLNGVLTFTMLSNPDLLGLGYVLAAIVSGILAYAAMLRTLGGLNRLTFIVNNPSTRG
jgi:uncharacterized membrane protein